LLRSVRACWRRCMPVPGRLRSPLSWQACRLLVLLLVVPVAGEDAVAAPEPASESEPAPGYHRAAECSRHTRYAASALRMVARADLRGSNSEWDADCQCRAFRVSRAHDLGVSCFSTLQEQVASRVRVQLRMVARPYVAHTGGYQSCK
jgi:hypothetical protein